MPMLGNLLSISEQQLEQFIPSPDLMKPISMLIKHKINRELWIEIKIQIFHMYAIGKEVLQVSLLEVLEDLMTLIKINMLGEIRFIYEFK